MVDIFENASKEAIWHGAASQRLSRKNGARKLIDDAVVELLGQFPDRESMPMVMKSLAS